MTEITVSESVELVDPKFRAIGIRIGRILQLAAEKAVAHLADPDCYHSDSSCDSLERLFIRRLRELPATMRNDVIATIMPVVNAGVQARLSAYGDLTQVQLASGVPVEEQARTLPFPPEMTFAPSSLKSFSSLHGPVVVLAPPPAAPQAIPRSEAGRKPPASPPRGLEFRIHRLACVDETGGILEEFCGTDTTFVSGVAIGATGDLAVLPELRIGTFDTGCVKEFTPPWRFCAFDLRQGSDWPKTYSVTLVLCDIESGNLAEFQRGIIRKAGEEAGSAVFAATGLTLGARGGIQGGLTGALAGWVAGRIFGDSGSWWNRDAFPPKTVSIEIPSASPRFSGGGATGPLSLARFRGREGEYALAYDWHLVP